MRVLSLPADRLALRRVLAPIPRLLLVEQIAPGRLVNLAVLQLARRLAAGYVVMAWIISAT